MKDVWTQKHFHSPVLYSRRNVWEKKVKDMLIEVWQSQNSQRREGTEANILHVCLIFPMPTYLICKEVFYGR